MAENYDIDKLIRQKFEDFSPEPPVQVWEQVRQKIGGTPPPSSPGLIMPVIIVVSLLVFLGGLIRHFTANEPGTLSEGETIIQAAATSGTGSTTISDASLQRSAYEEKENPIPASPRVINQLTAPAAAETGPVPVREPFGSNLSADQNKSRKKTLKTWLGNNKARESEFRPGLRQAFLAGELSYADAVRYDLSPRDIQKLSRYRSNQGNVNPEWSVGVGFSPEVTVYRGGDVPFGNTISFSLSILPQVSFNRFFIRSGVSFRMTNDKGNASVVYNQFLGTYEDVYLVTFDSTETGVIPTYYTQTVSVYDTIDHYYVSETKAKYSYLEIPVLMGYRITTGKFSLFANAGPAASFLVSRNLPPAGNPDPESRVINVDYQVPVRTNVNWQMQVGAGFDYRVTGKVSLGLEPTFRFALKPEYELPSGSNIRAFSYGIRAGIKYNF